MKHDNSKPDAVSVTRATDFALAHAEAIIKHALEYLADAKKKERLVKSECRRCFYINSGRIGGAAMTDANCGVCDKDMMFGSTNVDKICLDCGKLNELCVRCAGDIHMRARRHYERKMG